MELVKETELDAKPARADRPGSPTGQPASEFHIVVGESTPQAGGMCTHMTLLADGLAEASHNVHVWAPARTDLNCQSPAVKIHKALGRLSLRDLIHTGKLMNAFCAPRRLLVYWVPHAYGPKAMHVPLCLWLWFRSAWRKDRVELMVQECFLPFAKHSWKQSVAAFVQRLMTIILLRASSHVWIALPGYETRLRPYGLGKRVRFTWLPVPSNVSVVQDQAKVAQLRQRYAQRGLLIGHFGTFGSSITSLLEDVIPALLHGTDASLLLLGSKGEAFRERLLRQFPDMAERIHATGYLDDAALSCHLSACDVLIQPYPDGLTARRGSTLALLAHGRPIVTNATEHTESLWKETQSVVFAPMTGDGFLEAVRRLAQNPAERERLNAAARETYTRYFEPAHMVNAIQGMEP